MFKKELILILLILPCLCIAQHIKPVVYNFQIKGEEYNPPCSKYGIPDSRAYNYADSATLTYLAEKYVDMIFNNSDSLLLSDYCDDIYYDGEITLYSLINEGLHKKQIYKASIMMTDSIIYLDGLPYIDKQGMIGYNCDTFLVEDPETYELIMNVLMRHDNDLKNQLGGFKFIETWNYSKAENIFTKNIISLIPFVIYNPYDMYGEESSYVKKLVSLYVNQTSGNASKLLMKDMVYDVRIIPDMCLASDGFYESSYYKSYPDLYNKLIVDILSNAKTGKIKMFNIIEDTASGKINIDYSKPLKYDDAFDSLSYSTKTEIGMDTAKVRELTLYSVNPVINTTDVYETDEWGETIYPEWNDYNPVLISQKQKIVGYDTIWPGQGKYRKEIVEIRIDTLFIYKTDEYGDVLYPEENNYQLVEVGRESLVDTIWNNIFIGLDDRYEFYYVDTIYHNKIENIHSIRFFEDWYFDESKFIIRKKIKGVAFVTGVKKYNHTEKDYETISKCKVYFKLN
ncbi:MAG: hypothetical protein ABIJ97_01820 [Bacteroidota bacterium]